MRLQFKQQEFQTEAVNSVVDLFKGQEQNSSTFSLIKDEHSRSLFNEFGMGNNLRISNEQLIRNMHEIQERNKLEKTFDTDSMKFNVEMETGTGKTYVFTKTIFELNRKYGFTKFIIVVPSVAIREGIYKSLEITNDHFKTEFDNVSYNYFIYDSKKLNNIRQFATSDKLEIMIINIQAFIKDSNIINRKMDNLNGEAPIRYIQDTNPIVIIDEPQSVDNTSKSRDAIDTLNPMAVFRYSATHKDKINTLYKLTPVDAYNKGLVKQISVFSNYIEFDYNRPYIKLLSVDNSNGFKAQVEIDVANSKGEVKRIKKTVKQDSNIYALSGERELYDGYIVSGIDCTEGSELLEFSNGDIITLSNGIGDVNEKILKRSQIKSTIKAHLDKERTYLDKGIKVLSLFFVDKVENYRDYTREDLKGEYALMFEECYEELIQLKDYEKLRERFNLSVEDVHGGYFSKDKKGQLKNTKGDSNDDSNTYSLIMKDKEKLLSFDTPLRFIWSHSALKEGWDNPNVFQICTLIDQKSSFTIRQKIGRGLRLCVNQEGERIEDKNLNVLHVMANESFTEFASKLQREIETDTGFKFGYLQMNMFKDITYEDVSEETITINESQVSELYEEMTRNDYLRDGKLTEKLVQDANDDALKLDEKLSFLSDVVSEEIKSKGNDFDIQDLVEKEVSVETVIQKELTEAEITEITQHFKKINYIADNGKVQDKLKSDIQKGSIELPEQYKSAEDQIIKVITKSSPSSIPVRDARKEVTVKLKKECFVDENFVALWNKIKQKTTYNVTIDDNELKSIIVKKIIAMEEVPKAKIVKKVAGLSQDVSGVTVVEKSLRTELLVDSEMPHIPDIIQVLLEECNIPKKLSIEILKESNRLGEFIANPQVFIERLVNIVKQAKAELFVEGIKYVRLDGEEYYMQEVFQHEELIAYLDEDAIGVNNSIYNYAVYDSDTERDFAKSLDEDDDVRFFFKIPSNFKVPTPVGNYNPDWAVFLEKNGEEKLYFVIETKGTLDVFGRRVGENLKIEYGRKHFDALDTDVTFKDSTKDWNNFKLRI